MLGSHPAAPAVAMASVAGVPQVAAIDSAAWESVVAEGGGSVATWSRPVLHGGKAWLGR